MDWWQSFFDQDYLTVWGELFSADESDAEVERLIELLQLPAGARVLDAPCGYGRLSEPLAKRGFQVVGVDQSTQLVEHARVQGDARYVVADLRHPVKELQASSFDAAINMFSSIGYGSEADDIAVFRTIGAALKPEAPFFVDTMHRDALIARLVAGQVPGRTLADGTQIRETPTFDAISGRIETTWFWDGPRGSGSKTGSLRIYCVTELVALLAEAGFTVEKATRGTTPSPFGGDVGDLSSRLGLLCRRV